MSEANNEMIQLQAELQNLRNNNNIANHQVLSHQEVITSLMQENLNLRTNFKLSQQYYNDALKTNQTLNAEKEELAKKLVAINKELEALKNPSAAVEDSAQAA